MVSLLGGENSFRFDTTLACDGLHWLTVSRTGTGRRHAAAIRGTVRIL